MNQEIKNKKLSQEEKLDAIYQSVEKTRKYILSMFWFTVVAFILPLIALAFIIPYFLSTYIGSLEGLI